ncbi:hypothetical protein BDW75DRAFT_237098 [Aspergillus navahoensis]
MTTSTPKAPKPRMLPSNPIYLFLKRQTINLALRMQAREDEKRRKLGYGRVEDGPDDNKVPEYYNLIPVGDKQTSKEWSFTKKYKRGSFELTKNIDKEWRDLERNMNLRGPRDILIPARVTILLENAVQEAQFRKVRGSNLIHLTDKRIFSMPFNNKGKVLQVTGKVDHAIFSGDSKDLDVALVVLKATRRGKARIWTLLRVMAMIHHARKKESMDGEIYGIATDSTEWAFAHIDSKSRV